MYSFKHPNLGPDNWLIYYRSNVFLKRAFKIASGVLYDLGCGETPYRKYFEKKITKYVGVDWTNSIHRSQPDIIADLNEILPIHDSVADTVISLSVLEHLKNSEQFLAETFRILKPGGNLILQVPFMWWVHEAPYDYVRYTPYGLRNLLGKSGFLEFEIHPSSGIFTTIFLKLNYFSCRFIRGPLFFRSIIKCFLIPIWTLLQLIAIPLDKLDRAPELESAGYWVFAKKPLL